MDITIAGRVPSKKNHHSGLCIKNPKTGKYRAVLFLDNVYKKWEREQIAFLSELKRSSGIETIKRCSIDMTFFFPDKRKSDTRNKAEGIFDVLVSSGIIEDDNSYVVDNEHYYHGGVDTENPRVEIKITEL